jgi:hypothetical protein
MSAIKATKLERTTGAIALFGAAAAGDVANSEQIISPGAGAAATQTLAAPAISPRFSGLMFVSGGMTVSGSNSVIVTFALKRGSTIIQQRRVTSDASNGLSSTTFAMYDPAPATGSTIYSIVATPASGNVTIAANEGNVTVTETGA